MFLRLSIAVIRHYGQKQPEEDTVYLVLYLVVHHPEKSEQESGDRSLCSAHGGVLLVDWLSLLSYSTQEHQPRSSTALSGLGSPTSIINQENAPQTCP